MKLFYLIVISLTLALNGCGYKEGVATSAQKSYLYFTGQTEGVSVSIDNGEMFRIEAGVDNQYKIKPGKHDIKIYQLGNIILDRQVYVGNGISKEIEVQ